jgi:hypothetical protein
MDERKLPQPGDVVDYVDPKGNVIKALVTICWGGEAGMTLAEYTKKYFVTYPPSINVVFVATDSEMKDSYGRQISRQTSLGHKLCQSAHGTYWQYPDEELNPYVGPIS